MTPTAIPFLGATPSPTTAAPPDSGCSEPGGTCRETPSFAALVRPKRNEAEPAVAPEGSALVAGAVAPPIDPGAPQGSQAERAGEAAAVQGDPADPEAGSAENGLGRVRGAAVPPRLPVAAAAPFGATWPPVVTQFELGAALEGSSPASPLVSAPDGKGTTSGPEVGSRRDLSPSSAPVSGAAFLPDASDAAGSRVRAIAVEAAAPDPVSDLGIELPAPPARSEAAPAAELAVPARQAGAPQDLAIASQLPQAAPSVDTVQPTPPPAPQADPAVKPDQAAAPEAPAGAGSGTDPGRAERPASMLAASGVADSNPQTRPPGARIAPAETPESLAPSEAPATAPARAPRAGKSFVPSVARLPFASTGEAGSEQAAGGSPAPGEAPPGSSSAAADPSRSESPETAVTSGRDPKPRGHAVAQAEAISSPDLRATDALLAASPRGATSPQVAPDTSLQAGVPGAPALAVAQLRIAAEAARLLRVGRDTAELDLEPPELGKLKLRLMVRNRSVTGSIEVENPQVKLALEADMQALAAALEKNGVTFQRLDILLMDHRRSSEGRERPQTGERESAAASDDPSPGAPREPARPAVGSRLMDYWL